MCLLHDQSLHYIFQNIMEAFEQSKMVSSTLLKNLGAHLCTCVKGLFDWFESVLNGDDIKMQARLQHFKPIIDDLHSNGHVDSGTKIQFLKLFKDLSNNHFSRLHHPPKAPRNKFFIKLIHLKFDLNLCSFKEFCDSLQTIDNCAIRYIAHINDSKIYIRDKYGLKIRNFLGEIDATIEANTFHDLKNTEISLKRLADSLNYRLFKKMPTGSPMHDKTASKSCLKIGVKSNLTLNNIPSLPLQSPTTSTPDDESMMNSSNLFKKLSMKDDLLTSIGDTSMIEKDYKSPLNILNCLF